MPLYEYKCNACSHAFEKLKNFKDEESTPCPKCQSELTKRQMSTPQKLKMGTTIADHRVRDRLKKQTRPSNGGAVFTNNQGQVIG